VLTFSLYCIMFVCKNGSVSFACSNCAYCISLCVAWTAFSLQRETAGTHKETTYSGAAVSCKTATGLAASDLAIESHCKVDICQLSDILWYVIVSAVLPLRL